MFNVAEDAVEIGHAVEAAGEADFRYAPVGACHEFFSLGHPVSLDKPDKRHSRFLFKDM